MNHVAGIEELLKSEITDHAHTAGKKETKEREKERYIIL